jgi:very-short-patch-repair endonuclease
VDNFCQYDGGHHLGDAQILSDMRRDKAFESASWRVLVFDKHDLSEDFQRAVVTIKRALIKGWLDHPQASGFASSD